MLKLQSISDAPAIELSYHPDMLLWIAKPKQQVWQYLRDIIVWSVCFEIVNGMKVHERVLATDVALDFANKHKLLKDLIQDNISLCYLYPLGPSYGKIHGNACPDGGDAKCCPVCLETTFDFSLDCLYGSNACYLSSTALPVGVVSQPGIWIISQMWGVMNEYIIHNLSSIY